MGGLLKKSHIDRNGKMILKWLDDYNLTLLNIDDKCKGTFTFTRSRKIKKMGKIKTYKGINDYALLNNKTYNRFMKMKIDENKEIYDMSDHNLITVNLIIKNEEKVIKNTMVEREYYTKDSEAIKICCDKLEKCGEKKKQLKTNRNVTKRKKKLQKKPY